MKEKISEGKTYCSLCSRLRRGIIYRYAEENDFNKVALGHHRDDLITTLLMSILYGGEIKSMPYLTIKKILLFGRSPTARKNADYARLCEFPLIPCNLSGSQEMRVKVKQLIHQLAKENPTVPSNILHALQSVKPSQLMDEKLWDFKSLEKQQIKTQAIDQSDLSFYVVNDELSC